jgi:hypothetical protein
VCDAICMPLKHFAILPGACVPANGSSAEIWAEAVAMSAELSTLTHVTQTHDSSNVYMVVQKRMSTSSSFNAARLGASRDQKRAVWMVTILPAR